METQKASRLSLLINLAVAALVFGVFARFTHLSAVDFDEQQTFTLGLGLGLVLSGSVILQVRPTRAVVGFLLGVLGILCFAMAVI